MNITNFLFSLKVMGIGLMGIFSVTFVLIVLMKMIAAIFPVTDKNT